MLDKEALSRKRSTQMKEINLFRTMRVEYLVEFFERLDKRGIAVGHKELDGEAYKFKGELNSYRVQKLAQEFFSVNIDKKKLLSFAKNKKRSDYKMSLADLRLIFEKNLDWFPETFFNTLNSTFKEKCETERKVEQTMLDEKQKARMSYIENLGDADEVPF